MHGTENKLQDAGWQKNILLLDTNDKTEEPSADWRLSSNNNKRKIKTPIQELCVEMHMKKKKADKQTNVLLLDPDDKRTGPSTNWDFRKTKIEVTQIETDVDIH